MSDVMKLATYSMESLYPASTPPPRNLGSAIMLAAIADYRGRDEEAHRDAAAFLYPQTEAAQRHYDWAVALDELINAAWLRERLDQSRPKWDRERLQKYAKERRRGNDKRMGLGKRGLHDRGARAAGAVVQPARAARFARTDEVAAGV